jgi:hypothetical protein
MLALQYCRQASFLSDVPPVKVTCEIRDTVPLLVAIDKDSFEQILLLTVNMVLKTVPRMMNMHIDCKMVGKLQKLRDVIETDQFLLLELTYQQHQEQQQEPLFSQED